MPRERDPCRDKLLDGSKCLGVGCAEIGGASRKAAVAQQEPDKVGIEWQFARRRELHLAQFRKIQAAAIRGPPKIAVDDLGQREGSANHPRIIWLDGPEMVS